MQIVTECEKTNMYKVTWRDVYGEMQTDFIILNNSDSRLTGEDGKKAAVEIIMETNKGKILNITGATQVKHDNIYVAI